MSDYRYKFSYQLPGSVRVYFGHITSGEELSTRELVQHINLNRKMPVKVLKVEQAG